MSELRVAVVVNPRGHARRRSPSLRRLRESTRVVAELETRGDEGDGGRIAELLASTSPDVLVAAGGDGTAELAMRALLETRRAGRTALALLPLGTGNNAARSFGLRPLAEGEGALELALAAIAAGPRREVDVGRVGGRPFLGSFATGMDADVLSLRNRLHRRLERSGLASGYGLYLCAVAASLMRGGHGGTARLSIEGVEEPSEVYGLVVLNAPVYAGPLRFDGENDCADGLLDVLAVSSRRAYVSEYASAWLRYLRALRGEAVAPSPLLRRARELRVTFDRPVAAQVDGEPISPASEFRVSVVPRALRVCAAAARSR